MDLVQVQVMAVEKMVVLVLARVKALGSERVLATDPMALELAKDRVRVLVRVMEMDLAVRVTVKAMVKGMVKARALVRLKLISFN